MRQPHIDDVVSLNQDIPELSLQRGQVGVVRSTWFAPTVAYEVEFCNDGADWGTRALLLERQVSLQTGDADLATEDYEPKMFEQNFDLPVPL